MNIRNRLKKLEKHLVTNDIKFCECFVNYLIKSLDEVYDNIGVSGKKLSETETSEDSDSAFAAVVPVGDVCDKCQKPISEMVRNLYKSLLLSYG